MKSESQGGSIIPNLIRYQIAWFATVIGAAKGYPDAGSLVAGLMVLLHFWGSKQIAAEGKIVGITLLLGGLWELLMVRGEFITYKGGLTLEGVPLWILFLWASFGTTLNGCLGWFQSKLILAALFGALCGPLSWYAGERLGALTIITPIKGLTVLALGWALLMPMLSSTANRLTGNRPH